MQAVTGQCGRSDGQCAEPDDQRVAAKDVANELAGHCSANVLEYHAAMWVMLPDNVGAIMDDAPDCVADMNTDAADDMADQPDNAPPLRWATWLVCRKTCPP
jgi:hypothetical protein